MLAVEVFVCTLGIYIYAQIPLTVHLQPCLQPLAMH